MHIYKKKVLYIYMDSNNLLVINFEIWISERFLSFYSKHFL